MPRGLLLARRCGWPSDVLTVFAFDALNQVFLYCDYSLSEDSRAGTSDRRGREEAELDIFCRKVQGGASPFATVTPSASLSRTCKVLE
jgi:hypothetical protein